MSEEFYSVLLRTIESVGQDHAQLRHMIYRIARIELSKQLLRHYGDVDRGRPRRELEALEEAIKEIESNVGQDDRLLGFSPQVLAIEDRTEPDEVADSPEVRGVEATEIEYEEVADEERFVREDDSDWPATPRQLPEAFAQDEAEVRSTYHYVRPPVTIRSQPLPALVEPGHPYAPPFPYVDHPRAPTPVKSFFWSTLQLVIAVVLGVALYATFVRDRGGEAVIPPHAVVASIQGGGAAAVAAADPAASGTAEGPGSALDGLPVPTAYGVYVVSQGKLVDLQPLPIRVPDPRVGISAIIQTAAAKSLPDGHLQFIIFRRDLANNAPDRTNVRIVARVARALTFDASGRPRVTNVEGAWAVRSNAYAMKVSPVRGNPAMILVQPDDANFSFPAGRFALVLNNVGYDFSVEGKITDPAQCLERADTVSMPVYSQCRAP